MTPNRGWPKVKQKRLPIALESPALPPCLLWVLFSQAPGAGPLTLGQWSGLVSGALVRPVFRKVKQMDTPGHHLVGVGGGVGDICLLLRVPLLSLPNPHQQAPW